MEKMEREQRMLGVALVALGISAFVLLEEISGAGILLMLIGIGRIVIKDDEEYGA